MFFLWFLKSEKGRKKERKRKERKILIIVFCIYIVVYNLSYSFILIISFDLHKQPYDLEKAQTMIILQTKIKSLKIKH